MVYEYVPRDPREMLEETLLRDFVERYPDLTPVLDRMDINHEHLENPTLAEATMMHGGEPGSGIDEAVRLIRTARR